MIGKTLDPNGFELQDDGVVTSAHTEVVSDVDELIKQIEDLLEIDLHWSYEVRQKATKLAQLITSYTNDRETEARIDEQLHSFRPPMDGRIHFKDENGIVWTQDERIYNLKLSRKWHD